MFSVRSGKAISIREDKWLKSGPIGGSATSGEPSHVAELINQETATWNEPLIRSLFDDQRVREILATPIELPTEEDRMVWVKNKKGTYTVKSGYYSNRDNTPNKHVTAENSSHPAAAATSSYQPKPALWKFIWQSEILPKVKHFLWNACQNAIPTMDNLHKRKIVPNPLCPLCK